MSFFKNRTVVIIVLVLCGMGLLYWRQHILKSDMHSDIKLSSGIFDEYAQRALKTSSSIVSPSAKEHFEIARLVDLNKHQGHINNSKDLHIAISNHYKTLQADQNISHFQLDTIQNFNDRYKERIWGDIYYKDFVKKLHETKEKRLQTASDSLKVSDTPKVEVVKRFVQKNKQNTDDVQNVHDSAVNVQMRQFLDNLKKTTKLLNPIQVHSEIANYIQPLNPSCKERVKRALKTVSENKRVDSLGINENDLLCLVWSRNTLKENNSEDIKDSIVDALKDMITETDIVCAHGRCARLIESLAVIDKAEDVAGVMTSEALRNEALSDVQNVLQAHITESQKDPVLADVAKSYTDTSIITTPESEKLFKDSLAKKVTHLLESKYKYKMSDSNFGNVLDFCLVAVDSM